MNVELTADQRAFVRQAIESGRFAREEEAVQQALSLWEERERMRTQLLASIDDAERSIAQGLGRTIDESSVQALVEEVKRRGRARLVADTQAR